MSKNLAAVFLIAMIAAQTKAPSCEAQSSEPHPQETAAVQLVQSADKAIESEGYTKAIGSLKQAAKLVPDDMDVQFKLATALLKADRMSEMWQVLRKAALQQPGHPDIARGLLSYWKMYDEQGLFNCRHETIDKIISVLGAPDHVTKGPDHDRFIWGFLAVEVKHGQETVYQVMDMRGLTSEILEPRESVELGTDGRRVPGHRTLNQSASMVEFVMPGERVQNWTQLLSVHRMHGLAKHPSTVRQIADGMMNSLAKTNPKRKYRILEVSNDEKSVTFEWTAPANGDYKAQHEVVRMMRGAVDVHRIAFVVRGTEQMDPDLRQTWLDLFAKARLKPAGQSGPISSSPDAELNQYEVAWRLGHHLSIAVMAHAQRNGDVAKPNLLKSVQLAQRLGVSLPKPFERTEDAAVNVTRAAVYLYEDTLAVFHQRQVPDELTATFELAARTNTLAMLCSSRDLTEKSMVMINEATQRSPFPAGIVAALNERVDAHGEPSEIRSVIAKLHADAVNFLAKNDQSVVTSTQAISTKRSPRMSSQTFYMNGSKLGEVTENGEVWIAGDKVGDITVDGEIWVNGEKEGEITSEGEVWKAGNQIGVITDDGEVWREGDQIGSVENDGDVWLNGDNIGNVKGGSVRNAAAVIFFGFYDLAG